VHEASGGVSTATLPDVCLTPPGEAPVPYPNVAFSRDLARGSTNVRADGGSRVATAGSSFGKSIGGEAGGGGIASRTHGAEATWLTHSLDVRIEGEGACRLTDKMLHNHGNTIDCAGVTQAPVGSRVTSKRGPGNRHRKPGVDAAKALTRIHRLGIDTNNSTLDTGFALSQGCTFVGRYLSFDGAHPELTLEEANRIHAAGLELVAIWEISKYRAIEAGSIGGSHYFGASDATEARNKMKLVGGGHKPIYFTVDFPMTLGDWRKRLTDTVTGETIAQKDLILAYFRGILSVLPSKRVGAYGPYTVLYKLFQKGYIEYGWQWAFTDDISRIHPRAQLLQYDIYPGQDGWGVSGAGALDYDRAVWSDFGQW